MTHKILAEHPALVALAERRAKLQDKKAHYDRKATKAAAANDQALAEWNEAVDRAVEEDRPVPPQPELEPIPVLNEKSVQLTHQLMALNDEERAVKASIGSEVLPQLAERESEALRSGAPAGELLRRISAELTELVAARNEIESTMNPGAPREEVPTDEVAVLRAVLDRRDHLPPKAAPPDHAVTRVRRSTKT